VVLGLVAPLAVGTWNWVEVIVFMKTGAAVGDGIEAWKGTAIFCGCCPEAVTTGRPAEYEGIG
jgi:hypothetical protein